MKPNTCLVIDVWEGQLEIDESLLRSKGVAGIGIRLNDMNGGHHLDKYFVKQWSEAASFVRFPYFVYNPWVSGAENFKWLSNNLPSNVYVVAVDVEVVYPGYSSVTYAREVQTFINLCGVDGLKVIIYTGEWFMSLVSGWPKGDYWWAQYPDFNFYFPNVTTWEQVKEGLDKLDKPFNVNHIPGDLVLWQFGGDFPMLPGTVRKIDLNLFFGTEEQLADYFMSYPEKGETVAYKVGLCLPDSPAYVKESELAGRVDFVLAPTVCIDDRILDGWGTMDPVDMFINKRLVDYATNAWNIGAPLIPVLDDNPSYKEQWITTTIYTDAQDPQIRALIQALAHKSYHGIAIRVARYWRFTWQKEKAGRGEIPAGDLEILPPNSILDSVRDTLVRIERAQEAGKLRNVPIWLYTGTWMINNYCRDLDTLFGPKIKWIVATSKVDPLRAYMRSSYVATLKTWPVLRKAVETINANAPMPDWVGNQPNDIQEMTDQVIGDGLGVYDDAALTHPTKFKLERILNPDMNNILDMANVHVVVNPPPPDDPVDPPPPPVTKTKYYAQIRPGMGSLKLRSSKDVSVTTNIIDYSFAATGVNPSIWFEIDGEPVVDGTITWACLGTAYFAVQQGLTVYANIKKITL